MARSGAPQLYVAVDASKAYKCKWCGTLQSDDWFPGRTGTYCGKSCYNAAQFEGGLCLLIVAPLLMAVLLGPLAGLDILPIIGGLTILQIILLVNPYLNYRRIPRNSREGEGSFDLSLLRTISQHVECPNCDGNIDLSRVKEDMIYHCEYCGASGKVGIIGAMGK